MRPMRCVQHLFEPHMQPRFRRYVMHDGSSLWWNLLLGSVRAEPDMALQLPEYRAVLHAGRLLQRMLPLLRRVLLMTQYTHPACLTAAMSEAIRGAGRTMGCH